MVFISPELVMNEYIHPLFQLMDVASKKYISHLKIMCDDNYDATIETVLISNGDPLG